MSKLNISGKLSAEYDIGRMTDILRDIENQVNNLSEGRVSARYTSRSAAPASGTWAQSDIVYNSEAAVTGTAGSQYIVMGWICTASGTPGTWVAARTLTGT